MDDMNSYKEFSMICLGPYEDDNLLSNFANIIECNYTNKMGSIKLSKEEGMVLSYLLYELGISDSDISRCGNGPDFIVYDSIGVEVKTSNDYLTGRQLRSLSDLEEISIVEVDNKGISVRKVIDGTIDINERIEDELSDVIKVKE